MRWAGDGARERAVHGASTRPRVWRRRVRQSPLPITPAPARVSPARSSSRRGRQQRDVHLAGLTTSMARRPMLSYSISGDPGYQRLVSQRRARDLAGHANRIRETHLEGCEDARSRPTPPAPRSPARRRPRVASRPAIRHHQARRHAADARAWARLRPTPNGVGLEHHGRVFPFTANDATSGIAGNSHAKAPVTILGDGPGDGTDHGLVDNAGNEVTFSTPPVNIDRGAPIDQLRRQRHARQQRLVHRRRAGDLADS